MVRCVTVRNLCALHIHLDDTESTDEIGIDAIDSDAADGLVASDNLMIEVADIGNVAFQVYQVDVRVLINGNESFGLWTPADVRDIRVGEPVGLIVSIDALISLMILVESVRGQYEDIIIACCPDLLDVGISQIIAPSTDLGESE